MGRDVTGLRMPSVKAKPNGVSHEAVRGIHSRTSRESTEAKGTLVKEGTIEVASDENNVKHDVLGVKSTNLEAVKNDIRSSNFEETKPSTPENYGLDVKKGIRSSVENVETKHVVQKPLDAAGDQLAYSTPIAVAKPDLRAKVSPGSNTLQSPSSSKRSQSKTLFASGKHLDDEDNWSMASSHRTTASVRTIRSRTTVAVAPKFSVTERLEKRKEFYEKLGEKHNALEEEKRKYEARNKEEEQAAIKQLRKTMEYKANPVPSFYYEGPPPKKELKKLPTTRAISPKLSRRKSSGDAVRPASEEKVASARTVRHSLGSQNRNLKQGYVTPPSISKAKGLLREQSGGKTSSGKASSTKERPKQQVKESSQAKEPELAQATEQLAPAEDPAQRAASVPTPAVPRNMTKQVNTTVSVAS